MNPLIGLLVTFVSLATLCGVSHITQEQGDTLPLVYHFLMTIVGLASIVGLVWGLRCACEPTMRRES